MVKKAFLDFEPDFDFKLIALVCQLAPHTVCWWMEQKLRIPFKRDEELEIKPKNAKESVFFPIFTNTNQEETYFRYTLFGNKSNPGVLIPEQKAVDYYLKIEGEINKSDYLNLFVHLKQIPGVLHPFDVKPNDLKSKVNLIL